MLKLVNYAVIFVLGLIILGIMMEIYDYFYKRFFNKETTIDNMIYDKRDYICLLNGDDYEYLLNHELEKLFALSKDKDWIKEDLQKIQSLKGLTIHRYQYVKDRKMVKLYYQDKDGEICTMTIHHCLCRYCFMFEQGIVKDDGFLYLRLNLEYGEEKREYNAHLVKWNVFEGMRIVSK